MRKIIFDENLELIINDFPQKSSKITSNTPQINFLKKHIRDIKKEVGALKSILKNLKAKCVFDLMAGCGFSGKIILKMLNCNYLLLNDMDQNCFKILENNFKKPQCDLFQEDIFNFDWRKTDLTFIDFNSFTIKKLNYWNNVIAKASKFSEHLILTDSACYGFNLGNLEVYGCITPENYYEKISELFILNFSIRLEQVCVFGPAALLHFSNTNKRKFKFIEPSQVPMVIYEKGLLC